MIDALSSRTLLSRPMPSAEQERLESARGTLRALLEERRRLSRLGLETPLGECESQIRFWTFMTRILALPERERESGGFAGGGAPWRAVLR